MRAVRDRCPAPSLGQVPRSGRRGRRLVQVGAAHNGPRFATPGAGQIVKEQSTLNLLQRALYLIVRGESRRHLCAARTLRPLPTVATFPLPYSWQLRFPSAYAEDLLQKNGGQEDGGKK